MPLIFVPTPLGNLRDVTLRALDVLRDCDLLVAEDTRVARKLLNALALPGKPIWSYREQNAEGATASILERAARELVAVVTDAGMPGISDPGTELVAAARAAGVDVEVLPGPSAAIGAAVLSGFTLRRFLFEGFAPRASAQRRAAFARNREAGVPSIWFETPQRIRAALSDLAAVDPSANVFLLREYTKRFEEQLCGKPHEVAQQLAEPVRGEIVLVVQPSAPVISHAETDVDAEIDVLLERTSSVREIAKTLADRGLGERRAIYARACERKRAQRDGRAPQR